MDELCDVVVEDEKLKIKLAFSHSQEATPKIAGAVNDKIAPIMNVAIAADSAVAVKTEPLSIPSMLPKIAGFTAKI